MEIVEDHMQQQLRDQDETLEEISIHVGRIKHTGQLMHEELTEQVRKGREGSLWVFGLALIGLGRLRVGNFQGPYTRNCGLGKDRNGFFVLALTPLGSPRVGGDRLQVAGEEGRMGGRGLQAARFGMERTHGST